MKIAILLLCHEAPAVVAAYLASPFFRHPDVKVYIHHDARQGAAAFAALKQALPADVACHVLEDRVEVGWGAHSIVEGTRRLMVAAVADEGFGAGRLVLASASCHPIRSVATLQRFLSERPGIEFIQAHDIARGRWILDGLEQERYLWYFPFNFATHRRLFEFSTNLQRRLRIRRKAPSDLRIHFGSQWFCLTRETAAEVATLLARPDLEKFFRHSWIPDEFAIQTLVAKVRPADRIAGHSLTYYEFDRQGRPLMLENDHLAHVLSQPFFFARKVAPEATGLHAALHAHCAQGEEADLSWFARAGQPTAAYQRFLAHAEVDLTTRACIGTFLPSRGGAMVTNRRPYYVLYGASKGYLLALTKAARGHGRLPIFDFPFDRTGLRLAAERHDWYGFRPEDRFRARYDPRAFLRELVHVDDDPSHPTAFAMDPAADNTAREFIEWDRRAILVDCDPPGLDRARRAAAAMNQVQERIDAWLLWPVLRALNDGSSLPQDRWREPSGHRDRGGARVKLADLALLADDATGRALVRASDEVHARDWYPSRAEAELLVGRAIAPKP
jgi:hypothetical protein